MMDQHTAEQALEALRELHIGTDRDAEAGSPRPVKRVA